MPIAIAPITIANAAGFHTCLDTIAKEKRYLAQTEAVSLERIVGIVRENVANDVVQFVALDGIRVVGWADILPAWPHATLHCGSLGMGVLAAYRRQGLGEALLRASIAKSKDNGITRIELEARADNMPAIRLYEKLGFVYEALKRNAMRFDGVYFDTVQMSLLQ